MERIGVRELRQRASEWLRRTAAGETVEVTVRGRPVARLEPVRDRAGVQGLVEAGRLRPGAGRVEESEPLPAAGGLSASEALARARIDER